MALSEEQARQVQQWEDSVPQNKEWWIPAYLLLLAGVIAAVVVIIALVNPH